MVKPVSGAGRLVAPAPVVRAEAQPATAPAALGEATVHVPRGSFEQVLREALISLKEGLSRADREADPLARHLGFRALERELVAGPASVFEPVTPGGPPRAGEAAFAAHLPRAEEQQWAQELLQTVRSGVDRSFAALDDVARQDLALLLRQYERSQHRAEVEARCAALDAAQEQERTAARVVVERLAQAQRREAALPPPRPSWQVSAGLVLGVLGLAAVLLGVLQPALVRQWAAGLPRVSWGLVLFGLVGGGLGAWWSLDPLLRRAWLSRRLADLAELRRSAAQREAASVAALAHAKKLFEEVDAECQREEAALRAVLERRPGVERYVNLAGAVVAFVPRGAAETR